MLMYKHVLVLILEAGITASGGNMLWC